MGLTESHREPHDPDAARGSGSARPTSKVVIGLLSVIAVILAAWALKASAVVTMPLAFAFFVAILVHPIERTLAARLPRRLEWLGVVCAMLAVVGTLVLALTLIGLALGPVVARAPQYVDQLQAQWDSLGSWAGDLGLAAPQAKDLRSRLATGGMQGLLSGLSSAGGVLAFLALVFFFTLLMLIEASSWRRKTEVALQRRQTAAVLSAMPVVAHKVRWFMLVRTVLGIVSGVLAAVWLWLLGVDFAVFWGVLFFLLNYLPNIGSIIVGIPPTVLAFVQLGFGWGLLAAGGLIVLEQVMGNFLDPKLTGRTLNVSSLVVLLSVLFWGWIWGVPGALIAVPITVTLILVCANTDALRPIAVLLSDEPDTREPGQHRDRAAARRRRGDVSRCDLAHARL